MELLRTVLSQVHRGTHGSGSRLLRTPERLPPQAPLQRVRTPGESREALAAGCGHLGVQRSSIPPFGAHHGRLTCSCTTPGTERGVCAAEGGRRLEKGGF